MTQITQILFLPPLPAIAIVAKRIAITIVAWRTAIAIVAKRIAIAIAAKRIAIAIVAKRIAIVSTNQRIAPQLSTFFPPPCKETEKQSSPLYPYLKVKVCLALWWCHLIHRLMFNDLSTFQNFRLFSPKRKVACIYAILARSVLHIYAVGLYNYAFRPFSGTFSSVRVHTLCWP